MLSEEQKRRLEQAGWICEPLTAITDRWTKEPQHDNFADVWVTNGALDRVAGRVTHVLEFATILGIHPKGYRVVPEEVAKDAIPLIEHCWGYSDEAGLETGSRYWITQAEIWQSLASALQEDKPADSCPYTNTDEEGEE